MKAVSFVYQELPTQPPLGMQAAELLGERGIGLKTCKANFPLDYPYRHGRNDVDESMFTNLYATIEAATAAGMQMFIAAGSIPAFATVPPSVAYQGGHNGLMRSGVKAGVPFHHIAGSCADRDGVLCKPAEGDWNWAACVKWPDLVKLGKNLPGIDPTFMREAGDMTADRLKGILSIVACGNEYGVSDASPDSRVAELKPTPEERDVAHRAATDKLVRSMIVPFFNGVLYRNIHAQCYGPDAAFASDLRYMLGAYRENGTLNMLDAFTFHNYDHGDIPAAIVNLKEQIKVAREFSATKPLKLTELDANVEYIRAIHAECPEIDEVFVFDIVHAPHNVVMGDDGKPLPPGQYKCVDATGEVPVLTDNGRELAEFIRTLKPDTRIDLSPEIALADRLADMLKERQDG